MKSMTLFARNLPIACVSTSFSFGESKSVAGTLSETKPSKFSAYASGKVTTFPGRQINGSFCSDSRMLFNIGIYLESPISTIKSASSPIGLFLLTNSVTSSDLYAMQNVASTFPNASTSPLITCSSAGSPSTGKRHFCTSKVMFPILVPRPPAKITALILSIKFSIRFLLNIRYALLA